MEPNNQNGHQQQNHAPIDNKNNRSQPRSKKALAIVVFVVFLIFIAVYTIWQFTGSYSQTSYVVLAILLAATAILAYVVTNKNKLPKYSNNKTGTNTGNVKANEVAGDPNGPPEYAMTVRITKETTTKYRKPNAKIVYQTQGFYDVRFMGYKSSRIKAQIILSDDKVLSCVNPKTNVLLWCVYLGQPNVFFSHNGIFRMYRVDELDLKNNILDNPFSVILNNPFYYTLGPIGAFFIIPAIRKNREFKKALSSIGLVSA